MPVVTHSCHSSCQVKDLALKYNATNDDPKAFVHEFAQLREGKKRAIEKNKANLKSVSNSSMKEVLEFQAEHQACQRNVTMVQDALNKAENDLDSVRSKLKDVSVTGGVRLQVSVRDGAAAIEDRLQLTLTQITSMIENLRKQGTNDADRKKQDLELERDALGNSIKLLMSKIRELEREKEQSTTNSSLEVRLQEKLSNFQEAENKIERLMRQHRERFMKALSYKGNVSPPNLSADSIERKLQEVYDNVKLRDLPDLDRKMREKQQARAASKSQNDSLMRKRNSMKEEIRKIYQSLAEIRVDMQDQNKSLEDFPIVLKSVRDNLEDDLRKLQDLAGMKKWSIKFIEETISKRKCPICRCKHETQDALDKLRQTLLKIQSRAGFQARAIDVQERIKQSRAKITNYERHADKFNTWKRLSHSELPRIENELKEWQRKTERLSVVCACILRLRRRFASTFWILLQWHVLNFQFGRNVSK